MNREEARADLMLAQADIYYRPKDESIEMAIEALENQKSIIEEFEKIKAEIREWYWQADKQKISKDPCVVDAMTDLFIRTVDNHISELKGENK